MLPPTLVNASGTGKFWKTSAKIIRFCRKGCTNRPFYQIVVMERRTEQQMAPIEQVGTYDPFPNQNNEQLVSLNYERIRHWIGSGAHISKPVAELIGISGLLPIYPKTYMDSWRNRLERQKFEALPDEEKQKMKRGRFHHYGRKCLSDLAVYDTVTEEK